VTRGLEDRLAFLVQLVEPTLDLGLGLLVHERLLGRRLGEQRRTLAMRVGEHGTRLVGRGRARVLGLGRGGSQDPAALDLEVVEERSVGVVDDLRRVRAG
jgi:hypothetical protein